MPLSEDPEKRARQLANLSKCGAAAKKKLELPVVPYPEDKTPAPPKAPQTSTKTDVVKTGDAEEGSGHFWAFAAAGAAALIAALVFLNRPGGPYDG